VDYTVTSGVELAGVWGPWSLQGEYLRTDVRRSGRPDQRFPGWYLYGSWFITGGQRNYDPKDGAFDQVKPRGKYGAWELAARYSVLDLEDDPITGGKEENWTLGLNWYADKHMRLMVNWVHAEADPNRSGRMENIEAWMARFQYVF
jgi:phosphate-selective porin OprO/OprP